MMCRGDGQEHCYGEGRETHHKLDSNTDTHVRIPLISEREGVALKHNGK